MSRPETIADVKERFQEAASFDVDTFKTEPTLLKVYAAFIEAAAKLGGEVEQGYRQTVRIPKNKKQLEDQLKSEQYIWDDHIKNYKKALDREVGDTELSEWARDRVKKFAEAEGLPNPFDVFAANDKDLDEIRETLGMGA